MVKQKIIFENNQIQEMRELYNNHTLDYICKIYKISRPTLSRIFKENNIKTKTRTQVQKGKPSPMLGKHHTPEAKELLRQANIDKILSPETCTKMSESRKGENNPNFGNHKYKNIEYKIIEMYSNGMTITKISEELNIVISVIWNILKKNNIETRERCGENSPFWKGGISFEPYCPKFDEEKREEIRNKYNRCCVVCNKSESECYTKSGRNYKLHVHHVDYNKKQGCSGHKWMLVPLCLSCHAKTTIGNHTKWETKICEILRCLDGITKT